MTTDKKELREYREKFKKTCNLRVEECLELAERLKDPSSPDLPKTIADLDDKLTAMEGETQLLDFQDLAGLFTVLIETLRSPLSQKMASALRRGMTEGIVAALRAHIERTAAAPAKPAAPKEEHHTRRIVFIDDSEITREMIQAALVDAGHVVQVAENLINFDQILKEFNPDIILTDVNMPDVEGIEFISKIARRKKGIPIIVMSGNEVGKLFLESARLLGARDTITKPFSIGEITVKIRRLLSS